MAQTAAVQINLFGFQEGSEFCQKTQTLRGNFAVSSQVSGSPASQDEYQTGGLPISWAIEPVKTLAAPFEVQVWSAVGSGYQYTYNQSLQTLKIFGTNNIELAGGGTIPTAVLNDTIQFRAVFGKFDFFKQ